VLGAVGGKVLAFAGKKIGGMLGKAATDVVEGGAEAATTVGGDAAETAAGRATGEGGGAAAEGGGAEATGAKPSAGTEEPAGSTSEPVGCHSFQPDTKVLLADGTVKAIGDIQLGDEVASTDPAKGRVVAEPVVALHDNDDTDMADVTVQDEHGKTTTLHTTQHHPFWDSTSAKWVDAKDLPTGDALRAEDSDQHTVKIVAVKTWTALHHMRDLTVNAIHTYYVIAGHTPVLVHNCGVETKTENGYTWQHQESRSLIAAELDKNGDLTLLVNRNEGSPLRGSEMFDKVMNHFGDRVNSITGNFIDDNRETFNRLTAAGADDTTAALGTWTGKQASRYGFTSVGSVLTRGGRGAYSKIEATFLRP